MGVVDLFGTIGSILGFILCVSPAKSVYEGLKTMELKNLTLEYLLIAVCQSSLWAIYGHKNLEPYVYVLNDFVIICFLTYLNCYLYIHHKNSEMLYYNIGIAAYIFILYLVLNIQYALVFSTIVSTIWQFTTIRSIKTSLALKDATYINLLLAYVSFSNFTIWAIYSVLTGNWLMIIPNFCGFSMWAINIIIYYWTENKISDENIIIITLKSVFVTGDKPESNENPLLKTEAPTPGQRINHDDF